MGQRRWAEGFGSSSNKKFKQFLKMARRSAFENANILFLLQRRTLVTSASLGRLLNPLDSVVDK
jgi:four helix bundle protein